MLRSQAVRTLQSSRQAPVSTVTKRTYATSPFGPPPPHPSGSPAPNPMKDNKPSNTLFYTGIGLAGAGAAYLYFRSSDETLDRKIEKDQARIKENARQTADAVKDRAQDSIQYGRVKVDHAEDSARGVYNAAQERLDIASREMEERRRRGLLDRAEDSLDSAKRSATDTIDSARNSTENLYRDVRDSAERKKTELKDDANRKGEEVKEGWFSWLGYGKQKVNEGQDSLRNGEIRLESEADRLKREAAARVAGAAEDVRRRAEKHA